MFYISIIGKEEIGELVIKKRKIRLRLDGSVPTQGSDCVPHPLLFYFITVILTKH